MTLWNGALAGDLGWPRAEGTTLGKRVYASSPALLTPSYTRFSSQVLDEALVPGLWPRQSRGLDFGVQGQRPSGSTHPSVLPTSNTRPHLHGSPGLWELLGGFGEEQVAPSLWRSGAGLAVFSLLMFPLTQSDSPKICPLQSLGIRKDLSPRLPLCSHHHP